MNIAVAVMAPINYGIWGRPSSTIDWCEENYVVTLFIAEFWNTISNWIMIVPPFLAAYLSWKSKQESRIVASYASLGFVGLGSFAFHCTLIYKMQLMDELPMIYGSCILLYSLIEVNGKENKMNKELVAFFVIISIFITIVYIIVLNPLFFQWAYGLLAGWLFGLTMYNCKRYNGSAALVTMSMLSYGFGFILWNIDNNFCPQMRNARAILPEFVKPLTQLHAWWHTLAGAGTYFSIIYSSHLRLKCLGHQPALKFHYKVLPLIEKDSCPIHENHKRNTMVVNGMAINNNKVKNVTSSNGIAYLNGDLAFKANGTFERTK